MSARPNIDDGNILAQRLAKETQGEVLFSTADRGRYATDASIYQITPIGAFVPKTTQDVELALDICRDLTFPSCHAAVAPASVGKPWALAWSSTTASTCARCWM